MIAATYVDLDSRSFLPSARRLYWFVDNKSVGDGVIFEMDAFRLLFG